MWYDISASSGQGSSRSDARNLGSRCLPCFEVFGDAFAFGAPEAAVDPEKRESLRRAARDYARRANIEWARTRFDIGSIVLGTPRTIEWIRDAFR